MGPLLLLSPLAGLVSSVGGGLASLASGAVKSIAGALGGSAASEEEQNQQLSQSHGSGVPSRNSGTDAPNEETPVSEMFGGLDLTKIKSTLEDAGPMGPEEEGPKTVYKIMIGVLQGIAQTLLRMESTMKMLLAIEYERVKGIVSQSATENIIQAQTDEDPPEKKRGFFGRAKDVITGGYRKAKDSSVWMKLLGLSGILLAMNTWEEELKKGFTGLLKGIHDWIDDIQNDEKFIEAKDTIISKMVAVLDIIWDGIKEAAHSWLYGARGNKAMNVQKTRMESSKNTLTNIQNQLKEANGSGDLGFMGRKGLTGVETEGGQDMDAKTRAKVTAAAKERFDALYEYSRASDFAVQWKGLPFMRDGLTGWKLLTPSTDRLNQTQDLAIDAIINTQPIINGTVRPMSFLDNFNLDKHLGITKGMSEENIEGIRDNAAEASEIRWSRLSGKDLFLPIGTSVKAIDRELKEWEAVPDKEIAALQKESVDVYNAVLPDPDLQDEVNNSMLREGSIFTHDTHLEELLKPISKDFAERNQSSPVVVAPDNRNQSVTKLGDTYSGGLSSRVQESTAQMLAYTKNLNSTTGQFA